MKSRFALGMVLAAAALSFVGCATTSSSLLSDYNDKAKFKPVVGGPFRLEVLKGVYYEGAPSEKGCSNAEFVSKVLESNPTAHDVIQIRADQFKKNVAKSTSYSCRYSGIAVRYIPVDNWKDITDPLDSAAVALPSLPPASPRGPKPLDLEPVAE